MVEAKEQENGSGNTKVMVVIDNSECSYETFMWVLNNLRDSITNNSPLNVFVAQPLPHHNYVVSPAFGVVFGSFSITMELIVSAQRKANRAAISLMEKVRCICAREGIKVEAFTEVGDPKEAICNAVQNNEVNLLVIGNETNRNIKRPFERSISDYCGTKARCSVLVVRE